MIYNIERTVWSQELDSIILVGPFKSRIFKDGDSIILKNKTMERRGTRCHGWYRP